MSEPKVGKSTEQQLAELRATQAKRTERIAAAKAEQELKDELAIDGFRVEYGDRLSVLVPNVYVEGQPTLAAARPAGTGEIKRYRDSIKVTIKESKTQVEGSAAATELLARACALYPTGKELEAMHEAFPGFLAGLGQEVVRKAQGKAEEDAKS